MSDDDNSTKAVTIDYTNHKGERRERRILPISIKWGGTQWYPEMQWILHAFDEEKQALRGFAMKKVHSWK